MNAVRRGFCGAGSVARVCLVDRTVSVSSECLLRKSIFCSPGYAGNRTICCLRVPRRRLSSDRWIGRLVGRLPRHPDLGASRVVVAGDTVRGRVDETAVARTDTLSVVDVSTRSRSGEHVSVLLLSAVADTRLLIDGVTVRVGVNSATEEEASVRVNALLRQRLKSWASSSNLCEPGRRPHSTSERRHFWVSVRVRRTYCATTRPPSTSDTTRRRRLLAPPAADVPSENATPPSAAASATAA